MKINRRLVLLVTVPLVVAVTFAVLALAPATQQALQANRLTAMVDVASSASQLTHHLQRERAAATALVSTQGDPEAFRETSSATDKSVARFRSELGQLSSVPGSAQSALDRINQFIDEMPSLRAQVRSGGSTVTALTFGYRIVIADLIDYRDGIAQADGVDADVADRIRAAAAISRASEHMGQQQVAVMKAQATGGFTEASKRTFDATRIGYTEATGSLFDLGPQQWRTWLERTLSGPKALEARPAGGHGEPYRAGPGTHRRPGEVAEGVGRPADPAALGREPDRRLRTQDRHRDTYLARLAHAAPRSRSYCSRSSARSSSPSGSAA